MGAKGEKYPDLDSSWASPRPRSGSKDKGVPTENDKMKKTFCLIAVISFFVGLILSSIIISVGVSQQVGSG